MIIPSQGDRPRIVSILGNHSDLSTVAFAAADPYVKSGDIKILGMATEERSVFAPDIPTLREQGINAGSIYLMTVFAPKGTPEAVRLRLAEAYKKVLEDPDTQQALAAQALTASFRSAEEATAYWQGEATLYERLARENKLIK